ncbi:AraC family transcriptional regulator [Paenibacillus oceani]|uniref:AraC family transcriptional regulator n=1 Tax=Paenibacillus oceani TaxID=2772510 RepID=A0A927GZR3_9BACL|nr:helix-turn-helix domain-containing protein [Paenibacillus oceani]MBD2862352.1 AraC family transcriptional regulator [Paenibacillus oceani]
MSRFPEFQDGLKFNKFGKDDLPLYVVISRLTKNYRLHYHNFAELSLVIEGCGEEILNGKSRDLTPGTVSFLLPNHIHEIIIPPGTVLTKYCCMFDLNIVLTDTHDPGIRNKIFMIGSELPSRFDLDGEQREDFTKLIEDIFREYHSDRLGKNTVMKSKLSEACVFLLRTVQEQEQPHAVWNSDKTGTVMEMLKYIHLHYTEELSLSQLSELLDRNPSYLSSIFKRHVGQSFVGYVHALRIGRAASLIVTTPMTISEIALEVGFDNFRTFSKVFKEIKGVSPQDFRRQSAPERPFPEHK